MNKEVIYIEPEDDITDIITKIENSKERIVALVPPKKATVFRSIVNIKLIAKAGATHEKKVVLVTTDPSVMKLAGAVKLPVTKNLQSAPSVPEASESSETGEGDASEKDAKTSETENAPEKNETLETEPNNAVGVTPVPSDTLFAENEDMKLSSDDEEVKEEKSEESPAPESDDKQERERKKAKKERGESSGNPVIDWIKNHRLVVALSGVGVVILIVALVWAFGIAPAATIEVGIRTTTSNFSESVTFTDKANEENASAGKFYLETKKIDTKSEVEFEATGKKNIGEKASGELVVYAYFKEAGQLPLNAGTIFTYDDKVSYISQNAAEIAWDGKSFSVCDNKNASASEQLQSGCQMSVRVAVVAESSGTAYNVSASRTGWSTVANVGVYSDKPMAGGTDKTVTVVQQSDIDAAKAKIETTGSTSNKDKLFASVDDGDFIIESSFKQTVSDAVSTPAVGEEVADGKKAKLTVTTTDMVYVIDRTKVEEFIAEKQN